jgi:type IV pilus assembly protein PilM
MIRFTRAQVQPIAVDIGADSVKLLQMEVVGQSLAVIAADRQPLPPAARVDDLKDRTAAAAELIRRMLRTNPFSGRRIIAALPREIVYVKNLRLPLMPEHELRSAIEFEVKNIFPFERSEAHVRFLNAGEVRQGADARQEVLVIAARHSDVDTFVCELHRSGAIIESLDFEPSAVYRSVERFIRRREDEQEVHVLVDVGGARTQVVIGRGQNISFFKSIESGGQSLNEAVAGELNISIDEARALRRRQIENAVIPNSAGDGEENARRDPVRQAVFDATRRIMESLVHEVSLCLRYHSVTFRGHRPTRVRLIGGEASDPQLLSAFNAGLPIPTEPARPLHSVDTSRMRAADRRGYMSEWTTALGMSLKKTTGRFGARDGKPRNPNAPRPELGGAAQVLDLNAAVNAGAPVEAESTDPILIGSQVPQGREVVHA